MLLQRVDPDGDAQQHRRRGEVLAVLLGVVAILVVVVAGMADDGRAIPVTAVLLGPLFAGMLGTPRTTVFVGALALAAGAVLGEADALSATELPSRMGVVAAGGGASVLISSVRQRRDRELAELERVHDSAVRAMFANSAVAMMTVDADGTVTDVNEAMCKLLARSRDDLVGTLAGSDVHGDDHDEAARAEVLSGEVEHWQGDVRLRDEEMGWRWVRMTASHLVAPDGLGSGAVVQVIDISADKEAEAELQEILSTLREAVVVLDTSGEIHALNKAASVLYGLPEAGDLVGKPLPDDVLSRITDGNGTALDAADRGLERVLQGELGNGRVRGYRHPDGGLRWFSLSDSELRFRGRRRILISTIDITDRYNAERELSHKVLHDPLTGLANRVALLDLVTAAAQGSGPGMGIVFIDLDHFKAVNDDAGHDVGDQLLVHVAERLRSAVRPGDTVCRYAGDEFVVVCPDCSGPDDLDLIARRLSASLREPTVTRVGTIRASASMGAYLASVPTDTTAAELLRRADAALYEAKANGRGGHVVRSA